MYSSLIVMIILGKSDPNFIDVIELYVKSQ